MAIGTIGCLNKEPKSKLKQHLNPKTEPWLRNWFVEITEPLIPTFCVCVANYSGLMQNRNRKIEETTTQGTQRFTWFVLRRTSKGDVKEKVSLRK